jgi:hypothetical protein
VLAESEEELHRMLVNIHEEGIRYRMKINVGKTKVKLVKQENNKVKKFY